MIVILPYSFPHRIRLYIPQVFKGSDDMQASIPVEKATRRARLIPRAPCEFTSGSISHLEDAPACESGCLLKGREERRGAARLSSRSIPTRVCSARGDVLIAYELNGAPIPPHHGFPLRAVVPGVVGVRSVKARRARGGRRPVAALPVAQLSEALASFPSPSRSLRASAQWLSAVEASAGEATGPWQRGMAYKGFSPNVTSLEGIDVERIPSVQEQPVTSVIAEPAEGAVVDPDWQVATVRGYAYRRADQLRRPAGSKRVVVEPFFSATAMAA